MNTEREKLTIKVKHSNDNEFHNNLEEYTESVIPVNVRNILKLNGYNNASSLCTFDDDSIHEMEDFMRNKFTDDMLDHDEKITDYFGSFNKIRSQFVVVGGQKRFIFKLVEACRKLYDVEVFTKASSCAMQDEVEIPFVVTNTQNDLCNLIGSYMITVFNDAKRITLSGWSWPSRQIASQMSYNYKTHGQSPSSSSSNLEFSYLTPSNHKEFLDSIVETDMESYIGKIRQSLAMSVRVDGSTDRTQQHNIFVMVNTVNNDKDATKLTLFIGFGIPKKGRVSGYLECLKKVTENVIPWEEFFNLVTSLVTDGEYLNTGRLTGLCVQLRNERLNSNSLLPFFSIWCLPHRVNLAWKTVSKITTIADIIIAARKLSKHFRKSGTRNVTFLTDVLSILKSFQKTCQSDTICITDVSRLKTDLITRLEACKTEAVPEGWEKLFLDKVVKNGDKYYLCGYHLQRPKPKVTPYSSSQFSFTTNKRHHIIGSLILNLNLRLRLDDLLQQKLIPLTQISSLTTYQDLDACYSFIAKDMDKPTFSSDYYEAADLLKDYEFITPIETLRKINELSPDRLRTIKVALARIVAAKPNSADVERLISVYNKFKRCDRFSLSPETISNYLHINTNMSTLQEFDPAPAVRHWMGLKARRPKTSSRIRDQDWYKGVFKQSDSLVKRKRHPKIQF